MAFQHYPTFKVSLKKYPKQLSAALQYTYLHSQLLKSSSSFFFFPNPMDFQFTLIYENVNKFKFNCKGWE